MCGRSNLRFGLPIELSAKQIGTEPCFSAKLVSLACIGFLQVPHGSRLGHVPPNALIN